MKKTIALLAVCGFALTFVACGKKAEPAAETVDSTTVETPAPVEADTTAADTTATDTTAAH
ncbi:hypothetical protein [Ohtaekwangia koreensis]|uniref:Uncharacterized protein n=1 Tax=Ohtaekwangia koreensis TaxID=688867 RepID=A0A1T5LAM3_9BACT|nr:hypothetical protein [Ohtaekwangia koreensis]SKC73096.1 hypothetical protein SAMN05660236_2856 [Ohtaekwangia koreensis]